MDKKLRELKERYAELEEMLCDHAVVSDAAKCREAAKELSDIAPLVKKYAQLEDLDKQIRELTHILTEDGHGREFLELAEQELGDLKNRRQALADGLQEMLRPKDPDLDRNVMVEVRAGTGGQEASLFAADLYRMYTKYAAIKNWTVELMSLSQTEIGGVKEVVFSIKGREAYKRLKHESGVHRVQRVPVTEASGRIHTSAASVAVLSEPTETELVIDPKDLKIDVYRASGHGGQSVNTTDSAVRITHLPMGLVVTCQDERSQLKNKFKAMRVLRTRLQDEMAKRKRSEQAQERKSQIGSGDRSEKIRTYNFPDRRVTDHRIGFTSHRLEDILNGSMDELTDALIQYEGRQS